jgi:serine/threonine-protein kinase
MPFIDGESLRAALERKKKFSAREIMRILHDVVDALSFAHERGVIHRDIKPANILTQGAHALDVRAQLGIRGRYDGIRQAISSGLCPERRE